MTYKVLDVARYVINYCNEAKQEITNLRLQKILYFVQACFLVSKGLNNPCFEEEIEAWSFGPVIPEVYSEFKTYGNSPIPQIRKYLEVDKRNILQSVFKIYSCPFQDEEDKALVNAMIDECNKVSASRLVEITHGQTPWKNVYVPRMNNVIEKRSIYEYFKTR